MTGVIRQSATALIGVLCTMAAALAQENVEKSVEAVAGKQVQIGVFGRLRPDCSVGRVEIEVSTHPTHGKLSARNARLRAGAVPDCPETEVPVAVFFYEAPAAFTGKETAVIEIRTEEGQHERHNFSISVQPE